MLLMEKRKKEIHAVFFIVFLNQFFYLTKVFSTIKGIAFLESSDGITMCHS